MRGGGDDMSETEGAGQEASRSAWQPSGLDRGLLLVIAIAAAYALIHSGFRLLASSVLGEDDVIDIIFSQELRAAYEAFPRQPPLYNWVLWAVHQVTGPTLESFLFIKYAGLIAVAAFLYLTARRAMSDAFYALLTVESLALIYSISWRFHEGFTHEVGAMVAVMATAFLFVRLLQDGGRINLGLLSVAMGLGFLTEPAYVVFLASLLGAALLQPALRGKVLSSDMAMALAGALVIASPYLLWLLEDPRRLSWLVLWADGWQFNGAGLWDAIRGPIAYLSPLIFILPVIFPRWLKTAWADLKGGGTDGSVAGANYETLFLHAALLALALSIFGAVALEIEGLAVHVLMPLYLTSVIWLFAVARRSRPPQLSVKRFGQLAAAIALIAFVARMANLYVMEPACKTCRWGIPYGELARQIEARGFDGRGTIISLEHELSGNLRQQFPEAKLVSRRYPKFTPVGADWTRGRVLYIWDPLETPMEEARRYLRLVLPKGIAAEDAEKLRVPWRSLWRESGHRHSEWYVMVVENGRRKRVVNTGRERRLGL